MDYVCLSSELCVSSQTACHAFACCIYMLDRQRRCTVIVKYWPRHNNRSIRKHTFARIPGLQKLARADACNYVDLLYKSI